MNTFARTQTVSYRYTGSVVRPMSNDSSAGGGSAELSSTSVGIAVAPCLQTIGPTVRSHSPHLLVVQSPPTKLHSVPVVMTSNVVSCEANDWRAIVSPVRVRPPQVSCGWRSIQPWVQLILFQCLNFRLLPQTHPTHNALDMKRRVGPCCRRDQPHWPVNGHRMSVDAHAYDEKQKADQEVVVPSVPHS